MPPRDWTLRIKDILEAIARIRDYVAGMDFESFAKDTKTVDAVIRNIAIIGEAANNVPDSITSGHPAIPWKLMRDFRNVVVHVYFGVDTKIVWDTVRVNLPPLVRPLQDLMETER